MNNEDVLQKIRIILVETSHSGNIGASARAMKNMGLSNLYLVNPQAKLDPLAYARSSGADDVLDNALICHSLEQALSGTVFSIAMTTRKREHIIAFKTARQVAPVILSHATQGQVALVFGTEMSGLTNAQLSLCSQPVNIPAHANFSSLNLASAVQVMCYELYQQLVNTSLEVKADSLPASFEQIEGFYQHLLQSMIDCDFLKVSNPGRLEPRLRRLFGRIQLEVEEINILRGFLTAIQHFYKVR